MLTLVLAAATFFALHRLVSGGPLRAPVVAVVGEKLYGAAFGLASIACLTALWAGFRSTEGGPWGAALWSAPAPAVLLQIPLQLLTVLLVVCGLSTRNPTISGMGHAAGDAEVVRGALRITRHPFLWGVALFSLGHLAVAPSPAGLVFFGTLAGLALSGTHSIDAKRRRALGPEWDWFAAETSNLPFLKIMGGRQRLRLAEIGPWRLGVGIALWGLLILAHPAMTGGSVW